VVLASGIKMPALTERSVTAEGTCRI